MLSRRPQPEPTLSIYPHQVHIGDRFTDADTDGAAEWEVVSRPVTFKKGHEVRARVQRPGNPAFPGEVTGAREDHGPKRDCASADSAHGRARQPSEHPVSRHHKKGVRWLRGCCSRCRDLPRFAES